MLRSKLPRAALVCNVCGTRSAVKFASLACLTNLTGPHVTRFDRLTNQWIGSSGRVSELGWMGQVLELSTGLGGWRHQWGRLCVFSNVRVVVWPIMLASCGRAWSACGISRKSVSHRLLVSTRSITLCYQNNFSLEKMFQEKAKQTDRL